MRTTFSIVTLVAWLQKLKRNIRQKSCIETINFSDENKSNIFTVDNRLHYGSIDIGGTKIRMGIVDPDGQILARYMLLTPGNKTWMEIMDQIHASFFDMLKQSDITIKKLKGIGIGCPGTFDSKRETISFAPNLNWKNIPIKSYFTQKFPVPIWFENDTNLSTLGVATFGEGRNSDSIIGIFIGTGIGGGLIIDKKLYTGNTGGAGEIGHMVIIENGPQCQCGNRGCLEAIASTSAIHQKIYRSYLRQYEGSGILNKFKENPNKSDAIKTAFSSGEPAAVAIINEAFYSLGIGTVSLINLVNPELIVFGGGLAESFGDIIIKSVKQTVEQRAMPGTYENVRITCTALGEDAPIFGAAALVKMKLENDD